MRPARPAPAAPRPDAVPDIDARLERARRLGHRVDTLSRELVQRSKVYRVQGGESRQLITVSGGSITDVAEDVMIYIANEDELADDWRSKSNRVGASLLVLEVEPAFRNALVFGGEAKKKNLRPAQQSQDVTWKGVSYGIHGRAWANFLKKHQLKGHSQVWSLEEYFAQFETPDPGDVIYCWHPEDSEADGMTTSYAEYESMYEEHFPKWMPRRVAVEKGYVEE